MILVLAAAVLIALIASAFIALPLVRSPRMESAPVRTVSSELLARRDRVYGELRELEFDLKVGKVTGTDYAEARDRLESDAARVLRAIDLEITMLARAAERDVAGRPVDGRCSTCGASPATGARYCPGCGAPVAVGAGP